MREVLISDLVKDVLGPRSDTDGHSIMKGAPYDEFITGVLEPSKTAGDEDAPRHSYKDPGRMSSKTNEIHEGDTDDAPYSALLSPPLDPKKRVSSMGLTFMVTSPGKISLKVCMTWARYKKVPEGWKRAPRWSVIELKLKPDSNEMIDIKKFNGIDNQEPEVKLQVITRNHSSEQDHAVSIFLINDIKHAKKGTDSCIFQPQLRINAVNKDKTVIVPLPPLRSIREDTDESLLNHLYREMKVYARGHLVSAIWKDIDPVHEKFNKERSTKMYNMIPFNWIDGNEMPDNEKNDFILPEIRTEYVPIYNMPLPKINWDKKLDNNKPILYAEALSELCDPKKLRSALYPIYEEYDKWIEDEFGNSDNVVKSKLKKKAKTAAQRILDGINILTNPSHRLYHADVILSFCFANKVMSQQFKWSNHPKKYDDFMYRPFQLAFVLMCLESIINKDSKFRDTCDLIWVPTGTGKTEAYLTLAAFVFSYRRRRSLTSKVDERSGAGVSVLTRYTLRLLTIQQFRRILSVVTAAEYLRTFNDADGMPWGWRPTGHPDQTPLIWGSVPFSTGLWIGGAMTPNRFETAFKKGAKDILKAPPEKETEEETADPAQVLECPACGDNGILSIPASGLQAHTNHKLHLVIKGKFNTNLGNILSELGKKFDIKITIQSHTIHQNPSYFTLSLIILSSHIIEANNISKIWESAVERSIDNKLELCSTNAARPGYFFRKCMGERNKKLTEFDFEIFCPNSKCPLRKTWCGGLPDGRISIANNTNTTTVYQDETGFKFPDGNAFIHILEPFRKNNSTLFSDRIPINAFTSDYQVYENAPTVLISTSDKFARPPFEPKASTVFGNIEYHHMRYGYSRNLKSMPRGIKIMQLRRPDMILQDELHLTDGPLGSMMGIYESAVDELCSQNSYKVKYVASTATIKNAEVHIASLFNRRLQMFPPYGNSPQNRFFIRSEETSILDDKEPGRLYMGICAAGRGPLTPLIRIWARLAQSVWDECKNLDKSDLSKIDPYWTLTSYFNAIRELAGAHSLYRQDIPDRLKTLSDYPRRLGSEYELSSRTKSIELPGILDMLNREHKSDEYSDSPSALFTTSMFGTGIDISRLGLMLVVGQPKTTSQYIQATGRVGRRNGGLVITQYMASRARDLSHYEFFPRHHSQIHRFVEPPTIYPFSKVLMERTLGPILVFLLRNMPNTIVNWGNEDSAIAMHADSNDANRDVAKVEEVLVKRGNAQPESTRPDEG
ncbi:MAG: DISARM system helicase DrmA, partial [Alphaproteobacteria bacterium]|nr:DISARM system helicase DrmA [Alphaproteobacteria bacterium]